MKTKLINTYNLKRIHINQHNIRHNAKATVDPLTGYFDLKPDATDKTSANNHKTSHVQIGDNTTLIYSPDKPLACGAKVWIETTEKVIV